MMDLSMLKDPRTMTMYLIVALISSVTGFIVAFDARERGMSKMSAIIWGLMIQIFVPVVFVYLFLRTILPRPGQAPGNTTQQPPQPQQQQPPPACIYCGAPREPGSRVCNSCGRLL